MERKIGEKFEYENTTLEVVAVNSKHACDGCYFHRKSGCLAYYWEMGSLFDCEPCIRKDRASVIFKEVKPENKEEK